VASANNRRAILTAMAANIGIAIAKLAGYLVTGAASLLAESVHSLADSSNQGLLLWGAASAGREANDDHPFGYARERYFWAFVVALVIFSLGGLFSIYEGVSKVLHPHPLNRPEVGIAILLFAIVVEGYALLTAVREAKKAKGKATWWNFIRHTKNPELPVILLEDLGALLGLVLALLGVGLAIWTGNALFDALGSIAIGILLVVVAWLLATEMKSLLIGEAARPVDRQRIRQAILETSGVTEVLNLRTQHLGPEDLLVATKLGFDASLSFEDLARSVDAAEARVRAAVPAARIIYIEPDVPLPANERTP